MRYILLSFTSFFLWLSLSAQHVPDIYSNIAFDEKGLHVLFDKRKVYAIHKQDQFKFEDLYSNITGTNEGLEFDFIFPDLNGILYYGFINYDDGRYPQPVYFRESAKIEGGKTQIPIRRNLSGKYDMVNWEQEGKAILGYRIVSNKGTILYDGRVAFSYRNEMFAAEPTIIEGPFVNLLSSRGAVISFKTSKPVKASIQCNGKNFGGKKEKVQHEIKLDKLNPGKKYNYILKVAGFEYTFDLETAPKAGSRNPFTFAYCSDSRSGQGGGERDIYGTNAYIMKRIASLATQEGAKFMQFTGDLIDGYDSSKERTNLQYANWKHAVEAWWHYMPIYAGFGNHEAYNYIFYDRKTSRSFLVDQFPFDKNSSESLFQDNFTLPLNGPVSEDNNKYDPNSDKVDFPSYKESVYWYSYDNVAVVVLNSDYWYAPQGLDVTSGNLHAYIMDNQLKWLERTLKQLEKKKEIDHVFVSMHTPCFPNGGHVKDDMWYHGNNKYRPFVNGKPVEKGIIERRDELMDIVINKSSKTVAFLTGDEHNYNLLTITDEMERYPEEYPYEKLKLKRKFYQINNGAAGAPYYAQEKTPWMSNLRNFSTQNALVLIDIDGAKISVRVKNPDTLEIIDTYTLRD